MLLTIFAFYFGYKKAKATGRNAVLWAFICGLTFIGVQIIVPLAIGIFLGLGIGIFGWSESIYDDWTWLITLVSVGASIVALLILFRILDKVPDDPQPELPPPPPPSTFEQDTPSH